MEGRDWPDPIRTLRGSLPAEVRVLRGVAGFLLGVGLLFGVFQVLLGDNWHLGYGYDRLLSSVVLLFLPAVLGIVSPAWYWVGRPVWNHLGCPAAGVVPPLRRVRFLPGLAGSVLGVVLLSPVSATSGFWVQTLGPFGLAVGLASPVWFWLLGPLVLEYAEWWPPASLREPPLAVSGTGVLAAGAVLLALSVVLTAVIALPTVGIGEQVSARDLDVTVTDARVVTELTAGGDEITRGAGVWRYLLVRVVVENRGSERRPLPGTSVGDVAVIAPVCSAQTFGEPSHNCNRVHADGPFGANGSTYPNLDDVEVGADGTIAPGGRVAGWLAFRLESRPADGSDVRATVVVDDVGRWRIEDTG